MPDDPDFFDVDDDLAAARGCLTGVLVSLCFVAACVLLFVFVETWL